MFENPHRRYNPLTGDWLQVSPQRTKRPWLGQSEEDISEDKNAYEPKCYLCPGNERAGNEVNPNYESTFVFTNDYSAILPDTPEEKIEEGAFFHAVSESGYCRVVCFSPRHDLTIPQMDNDEVVKVIETLTEEYRSLGNEDCINHVQIFENKGKMMGASNPHPHGQIWAQNSIPDEPLKEMNRQLTYYQNYRSSMLGDYLDAELKKQERIVVENDHFVALVPFWAVWPFETMIISRRHVTALSDMSGEEQAALANIYRRLTIKYDNLFRVSFPYSAGMHQAPTDGNQHNEWHFHLHFYPPLLRSATVKKFMVGYEMLGNPQRDITAETAAEYIREQPAARFDT